MKQILDWLNPSFLQNIDRFLLLNYRIVWVSKIHYVLFYGFLAIGALSVFTLWLPISPSNVPSPSVIATILSVFALVPFAFWVYKQITYNIEKEFGQRFPFMEHSRWALNLICIAVFALMPMVGTWLLQQKVANLVSDQELIEDINKLNLGNPYFPTNIYADNVFIVENLNADQNQYVYKHDQFTPYLWEQASFKYGLNWLNEAQLQKTYDSRRSENQKLRAITDYMAVMEKYGFVIYESPVQILENYQKQQAQDSDYSYINSWAYQKNELKSIIYELAEAKEGRMIPLHKEEFWTLAFLMVFMASGLLVIYKSVNLKEVAISVVAFVCSFCLIGLFAAFTNEFMSISNQTVFTTTLLVAYAFVLMQGLSIFSATTFSRFKLICLILANVGAPFIFMLISEFMRDFTGSPMFGNYQLKTEFWLGIVTYFVVFMPLFRSLYMRSQALPKS